MGRKGIYEQWLTDDALTTVRGWARDGLNNQQIAHNIGIRADTFSVWLSQYPQLSQALKKGREPVAVKVEDAFYSKCEWQDYEETREEITRYADGTEVKKIVRTRHKIPPDTAALIFALKNLRPDKYRDKPIEIDASSVEKHDALVKAIEGIEE